MLDTPPLLAVTEASIGLDQKKQLRLVVAGRLNDAGRAKQAGWRVAIAVGCACGGSASCSGKRPALKQRGSAPRERPRRAVVSCLYKSDIALQTVH